MMYVFNEYFHVYNRTTGLLLNEYLNSGDVNFAGESGSDTNTAYGNSEILPAFVNAFSVLGATGTTGANSKVIEVSNNFFTSHLCYIERLVYYRSKS